MENKSVNLCKWAACPLPKPHYRIKWTDSYKCITLKEYECDNEEITEEPCFFCQK